MKIFKDERPNKFLEKLLSSPIPWWVHKLERGHKAYVNIVLVLEVEVVYRKYQVCIDIDLCVFTQGVQSIRIYPRCEDEKNNTEGMAVAENLINAIALIYKIDRDLFEEAL